MTDETLLEFEASRTRAEVAAHLRSLAEAFDGDGETEIAAGDQRLTLSPPENLEFELEVEREADENDRELSVEAEIEWDESAESTDRAGDEGTTSTADRPTFECYVDRRGQWRWRLRREGIIIATGARGFDSRDEAHDRIEQVRTAGPLAETIVSE